MKESKSDPKPSAISLKAVAEEIGALPNEEWTLHLNRRTGELYTVTLEDVEAIEDPDDPTLPDWHLEVLPKVREVMESADSVEAFVARLDVLAFSAKAAAHYGQIRTDLERGGTPAGPHDMLIGAHARSEGLIVVTNNAREFKRMPGVRAEIWV